MYTYVAPVSRMHRIATKNLLWRDYHDYEHVQGKYACCSPSKNVHWTLSVISVRK